MNHPKYPVHSSTKFKPGITVIRQLQINEYSFGQDFYGLIDDQGNEIIPCECQYFIPMGEGLIKAEDRLGNVGILYQAGNFVVPLSRWYQSVGAFHNDRALVRSATLPLAYGFIDRQGNEVSPLKYANAGYFCNGIAAVQKFDGKKGVINKTGKWLTPIE